MVIGLGLCPFAEQYFKTNRIHFTVSDCDEPEDLLVDLSEELQHLAAKPRAERETTLLIAPGILPDFLDFNDFAGDTERLLEKLGLTGTIQIVGFHPSFRFADVAADAPENYTNRSPYPMLHLLREESVTEVTDAMDDVMEIPKRNSLTLQRLGTAEILARLKSLN